MEKLNRQNTEHSQEKSDADSLRQDDRGRQESAELILDGSETCAAQPGDRKKVTHTGEEEEEEEEDGNIFEDSESEEEKQYDKVEDDEKRKHREKAESSNSETSSSVAADICLASPQPQQRYSHYDSCSRNIMSTCHKQANPSIEWGKKCNEFFLF